MCIYIYIYICIYIKACNKYNANVISIILHHYSPMQRFYCMWTDCAKFHMLLQKVPIFMVNKLSKINQRSVNKIFIDFTFSSS